MCKLAWRQTHNQQTQNSGPLLPLAPKGWGTKKKYTHDLKILLFL